MKNSLFIIYFVIPVILFSCGKEKSDLPKKDNKTTFESKEIDACSFLDKTEIEKIFLINLKDPKKGRSQKGDAGKASFSECSFESEEADPKIFLSVYIRFTPIKDENYSTIQSVRNSFKQSGIEVKEIDGISEVAFWGGNQLHIFMGDNYYFIITLLGIKDQDEAIEKAKLIALYTIRNLDSI